MERGGGPATARSRCVLVVEDDPGLCDAIGRLARGIGMEVWQAPTLDEGLALLQRGPDLVIADLRLAGLSSFPLIEAAVRRTPSPAVVAMSGQVSAEESFRLGQLGVHAYVAKPFNAEVLVAAIERAERERHSGAVDGGGAAALQRPESEPAPALESRLRHGWRRLARRVLRPDGARSRRGPPAEGS